MALLDSVLCLLSQGPRQASGQQPAAPQPLLFCSDLAGLVCQVSQARPPLLGQVGRWELCFLAGSHPGTLCKPKKLAQEREDMASLTAWVLARGSAGLQHLAPHGLRQQPGRCNET